MTTAPTSSTELDDLLARAERLTPAEANLLRAEVASIRQAATEARARVVDLEGEKERAIRWAVHLEGDHRRQENRADEAREQARVATVAALNLQQQTPDKAHRTLDRIRQATSWSAVWIALGQYYGLSAEQAGTEARSRRIGVEIRAERTEKKLRALVAELETSLRDRIADAIRAATCPGECEGAAYCEHGRFQPTVWDDNGQPVEVGISGPPDRIAAIHADALAKETL
uniref:PCQ3_5 n=1 Tax=Streptomyces sp. W9 TaxID=682410 RepID=D0UZ54_9ACTN|nr:hypothetical protein [Streptomyces sp. W9]ACX85506.1 pCQ3_5 [Streptomyces sp. W9]